MSENFTGVYLTMLSIIQGVALTDLANIAFSEHSHFTIFHWIEVATMVWSLIYIWNHFMGDALMTHWIPDLEDAALLFGTGVFELVANHAIIWGATAWVATIALMLLGWTAGVFYIRGQEERVVREPVLLRMLRSRSRPLLLENLGGSAFLGVLAIAGHFFSFVSSAAVVAAFLVSLLVGLTSAGFWRQVRRYAQTGATPAWLR